MSLTVHAYTRTPDGHMVFVDPVKHSDTLAGFESYRQRLYGGEAARALGLRLLPKLDGEDLYVEGADLDRLRAEAETALANVERFEAEAGATAESIRPRFENIIAAAHRAAEFGGGVVIW